MFSDPLSYPSYYVVQYAKCVRGLIQGATIAARRGSLLYANPIMDNEKRHLLALSFACNALLIVARCIMQRHSSESLPVGDSLRNLSEYFLYFDRCIISSSPSSLESLKCNTMHICDAHLRRYDFSILALRFCFFFFLVKRIYF